MCSGARVVVMKDCVDAPAAFVLHLLLKCALAGGCRAALLSTNPVGQSVPLRHRPDTLPPPQATTPPVQSVRGRRAHHHRRRAAPSGRPGSAVDNLRLFRLRASIWTPIPLLHLEGISIATTMCTEFSALLSIGAAAEHQSDVVAGVRPLHEPAVFPRGGQHTAAPELLQLL